MVVLSRRMSAHIGQTSVSEMLWHILQYFMPLRKLIIDSPSETDVDRSSRNRCKASLKAVFRPIPGKRDISVTAVSSNADSNSLFMFLFEYLLLCKDTKFYRRSLKSFL